MGLQELRRRRAERHRGPGLRLARPDDLGADDPGRQDGRGGGRARHGHPPLPRAPEGQQDVDEPDRFDLRLDAGPHLSRQDGRDAQGGRVRRGAGERLRRGRRGRRDDQGPCHPDRQGRAVPEHRGLPRRPGSPPPEQDGLSRTRSRARVRVSERQRASSAGERSEPDQSGLRSSARAAT